MMTKPMRNWMTMLTQSMRLKGQNPRYTLLSSAKTVKLPSQQKGFTFIEVLVVMIILALIAGVVGTQLLGEAEKAKVQATKVQIKSMQTALDLYRLHNSRYPSTEQGLEALIKKPDVGNVPRSWQGPYLKSNNVPTDAWSQPFGYISTGSNYAIISYGADGVEGGEELDADITNN